MLRVGQAIVTPDGTTGMLCLVETALTVAGTLISMIPRFP